MSMSFFRLVSFAGLLAITCGYSFSAETSSTEKQTTASRIWNFFGHYEKRVAQIKADLAEPPADTTSTVVLLGDSITEAHPAKMIGGMRVVNMGISGDQIEMTTGGGVLRRIDLVQQAKPAHVFLMIGINDLGSSKPLAIAKEQHERLIEKLRELVPAAKLHVQSVLPTTGRFAFHKANVLAMNEYLEQMAKENGADFIDLHSIYKDENGLLRQEVTRDGLHLIREAYQPWIEKLDETVAAEKP